MNPEYAERVAIAKAEGRDTVNSGYPFAPGFHFCLVHRGLKQAERESALATIDKCPNCVPSGKVKGETS